MLKDCFAKLKAPLKIESIEILNYKNLLFLFEIFKTKIIVTMQDQLRIAVMKQDKENRGKEF